MRNFRSDLLRVFLPLMVLAGLWVYVGGLPEPVRSPVLGVVYADVQCSSTASSCAVAVPTAVPTATPAPTFPSTGNFGTVTPYTTLTTDTCSASAATINWSTGGPNHTITVDADCTYSFTAPNSTASLTLILVHAANATTYTLTWPTCVLGTSGVCWPSGSKISNTNTSGARDIVSCKYNGANYFCVATGTNFS